MGALLLLAVLLANPVVVFAVTGSIEVALGVCLAVILLFQLSLKTWGHRLPTVYIVNATAFCSLFLHGELVVRTRFADYVIDDLYTRHTGYYFNKPFLRKRLTDKEYAVDYLTNRDGFRVGYSQDTGWSFATVDWLFVGDSFTQGAQVPFESLYTTQLYRALPDRIIANAGISGFGLPEEYEFIVRSGLRLRPRIVFLQLDSFNDFMKVRQPEFTFSDYLVERSDFMRFLLQDLKYNNPAALPLGRWVEPFYPDRESNRRFNVFFRETSPQKEEDLRQFDAYHARIDSVVTSHGSRLVVLLVPTKEQVSYRYLAEVLGAFKIDPHTLDLDRPNRIVKHLADSLRFDFIDLRTAFEDSPEQVFFSYDEHLNPSGHRLVAQVLERWLKERGDSSSAAMLSPDFRGDRYPSAIAAGREILFQARADGNSELFVADSGFARLTRLTTDNVDQAHPSMSRTGDRLVYTEGDQSAGMTKVVMAHRDGSDRVALTSAAEVCGAIPDISRDGARVVYAEWRCETPRGQKSPAHIVLLDLGTGSRLALSPADVEAWRPVFSPDAKSVAYIRRNGTQFDLFAVDVATREERQLTNTPWDEWDPRFSEDGRKLAYAAHQDGNWDLFMMDLTTSHVQRLTRTLGDEWDPSVTPDNRALLYAGEYGIFKGIYRLTLPPKE